MTVYQTPPPYLSEIKRLTNSQISLHGGGHHQEDGAAHADPIGYQENVLDNVRIINAPTCTKDSERLEISKVESLDMLHHNGYGYRQEWQISGGG